MSTSDQARADAMADAETLTLALPFLHAAAHGHEAVKQMGWVWGIEHGMAGGAVYHATFAARAAFRAVPGLRA